jgi:hypothetical protein
VEEATVSEFFFDEKTYHFECGLRDSFPFPIEIEQNVLVLGTGDGNDNNDSINFPSLVASAMRLGLCVLLVTVAVQTNRVFFRLLSPDFPWFDADKHSVMLVETEDPELRELLALASRLLLQRQPLVEENTRRLAAAGVSAVFEGPRQSAEWSLRIRRRAPSPIPTPTSPRPTADQAPPPPTPPTPPTPPPSGGRPVIPLSPAIGLLPAPLPVATVIRSTPRFLA